MGPSALVEALSPDCLELIGRSLIRSGQVVFLIDTQGGRLRLLPAQHHDIEGSPDPESWEYEVTLAGPSRTYTHRFVPGSSVLHFRYAPDATSPWRGLSPIEVASLAGRLSAETTNALANESSGPVGRLLGIPKDGDDKTVENLKADITNAKGRTALLETGDWDNVGSAAVQPENRAVRGGTTTSIGERVRPRHQRDSSSVWTQHRALEWWCGIGNKRSMAAVPVLGVVTVGQEGGT